MGNISGGGGGACILVVRVRRKGSEGENEAGGMTCTLMRKKTMLN